MTREEIQTEVSKLNESQRAALRSAVGPGTIQRLAVTGRGPYTQVDVTMYEHNHLVMIGPRGRVMARDVY